MAGTNTEKRKFYWIMEVDDLGSPRIRYSEHSSLEDAEESIGRARMIAESVGKEVSIVALQAI